MSTRCDMYGSAVANAPMNVRRNQPCPRVAEVRTGAGQPLCKLCLRYHIVLNEAKANVARARLKALRRAKPIDTTKPARPKGRKTARKR